MRSDIDTAPPRPRRSRTIWWVLGLFAVVTVVAVFAAFALTSGAVTEADRFLQVNAAQGAEKAWNQTSPGFQSATTREGWAALSQAQGLNHYVSASWNRRSVSGQRATLSGTVNLADGRSVPAELTLIEDSSGWKVQSIGFGSAGASSAPASATSQIPGEFLASACRDILAQKTGMQLDGASCPSVAAVRGAVAECTARRDDANGPLRVTIDGIGDDGHISLDCKADLSKSKR
ncbi:hypothetical protein RZN05_02510 [Sphingomonas sp. HF-S4]|uniref:DUF4333 domain-containing protein n=1 Tax=Sphingomonas agrestis TaxID=3080540 RepID=A0ABU3Y392_9SPHN|nr:hypothetical protein [Sphingomonas sp. HF-S4]MDV3455841.1 hypothetical protein [Sphingomonas sp. HF-S4]